MLLIHDTRQLQRLGGRLRAWFEDEHRPLLERLGARIAHQTRARLARTKRDPDGAPWVPWSTAYAADRPAGVSLLRSSGRLLQSIEVRLNGAETVEVGSALPYAATHQYGEGGIPARPFLGLGRADQRGLLDTLALELEAILSSSR